MKFSDKEKTAITRVLEKVAKANGKLIEDEMQVLLHATEYLKIDSELINKSKGMSPHEAGVVLKAMDPDKLEIVNSMLVQLMASDGKIEGAEVKVLLDVFFKEEDTSIH